MLEVRAHGVPFMLEDGQPIRAPRLRTDGRGALRPLRQQRARLALPAAGREAQPPVQGARGEHPLPDDQRSLTQPSNPPPDTAALPARILVGRRSERAAAIVAQQTGPQRGNTSPGSAHATRGRNGGAGGTGRNGRGARDRPGAGARLPRGPGLPAPPADAASGVAARAGAARAHRGRDRRRAGATAARTPPTRRPGSARASSRRSRPHGRPRATRS